MREEYIKPEIMIVDFEAHCGILATSSLILDLDEAEEAGDVLVLMPKIEMIGVIYGKH